MSPRIFISYRREDSAGHAGRLYDRLAAHFGEDNVFMDVDTLDPGVDFVEVVDRSVRSCDALVAVIGRSWLGTDPSGVRRIDNPRDFVRLELEAALSRGVLVVPALVQDARMPGPDELPETLGLLARRNGIWLSHERWDYDVSRLIGAIEEAVRRAQAPEPIPTPPPSVPPAQPTRNTKLIAGIAAAVLLLTGLITFAVVRSGGDGEDTNRAGSTTQPTAGATLDADIGVTIDYTRTGYTVDYRVIGHNAGPDDAANVRLHAAVLGPTIRISNVRTTGGTCTLEKSSVPNEIDCTYSELPATGDAILSFRVTVSSGGTLDVEAEISSTTPDDSPEDQKSDSSDEPFDPPSPAP